MNKAVVFRHDKGDIGDKRKVVKINAKTDRAMCISQTLRKNGGETNLHSHTHLDGFWFVLEGRARFYTTGDELIAELGKHEGVLIPRGFPYWFEGIGDNELELLQIEASDRAMGPELKEEMNDSDHPLHRVDHQPRADATGLR